MRHSPLRLPRPPIRAPRSPWRVRRAPGGGGRGLLAAGGAVVACMLGRGGVAVCKREGDGATPAARMTVLGGYRNPRRFRLSPGAGALVPADAGLGWCDAPEHPAYNRPVRLPFRYGHESMLRDDRLYDICLVLDWNIRPRARRRGSAIFLHLTNPEGTPTAGCIALEPGRMRILLPRLIGRKIVVLP